MTLSIRRAGQDDLDALARLFDAYRQFYAQPPDLPRARAWLSERIARNESIVLLACNAAGPVGFTQLYPMFSSVRTARLWILNDLFVAAEGRRQGVARALLDAAARACREDGAAGLMLETGRDNAAARALYRAAGWHEDATQWYSLDVRAPSG
jgi:ribosomal protein S18 acetylase RimI-like enzyme